jgi:hypothetical protein
MIHISKLNGLKVIYHLFSQCLTKILSKTTSFSKPDGVAHNEQTEQSLTKN